MIDISQEEVLAIVGQLFIENTALTRRLEVLEREFSKISEEELKHGDFPSATG